MHGLVRPRRAVLTPDRFKIEVLVTSGDFEPHAACPISIEDQDTISEDAVNQVGGRGVQHDKVNRPREQSFEIALQRQGRSQELRRWWRFEQHCHVHIARRRIVAACDTPEHVDRESSPRIGLEKRFETVGGVRHAAIMAWGPSRV